MVEHWQNRALEIRPEGVRVVTLPDEDPPIAAPVTAVTAPPPIDAGLVAWRRQFEGAVNLQPGIEVLGSEGGSFHFRFRGQEFMVSVRRVS